MSARVAHVITKLELGGAQQNTLHTVRWLDRERYRVSLLCGAGGLLLEEARRIPQLQLEVIPGLRREPRPGDDLRALAGLVGQLRRGRYQLVHTHSSKAGILGRLAAHLAGVPVVIHSIHGFGFNRFQKPPVRACFLESERLVARFTSHFIAVSQANLEEGLREGLYGREQVTRIYSGIELEEFRDAPEQRSEVRAELGLPPDCPLLTMVACFKPQKDPLAFVELAARLRASHPAARFLMVGDGVLAPDVRRRAAELGVADRLLLTGWRRDVPRLVKASDLVVLTSLWEGLPRVVPQAMAAGRPVVATAVDGTPEAITDGVTGFLVPPRRPELMAERVARLLADPERRRRMGANALERVEPWDIARMVPAQEQLYERLLRRAGCWRETPGPGAGRSSTSRTPARDEA